MNEAAARPILKDLYRAALSAVDPRRRVAEALEEPRVARALDVRADGGELGVFAVGKAAAAMIAGAALRFGRGLAGMTRRF